MRTQMIVPRAALVLTVCTLWAQPGFGQEADPPTRAALIAARQQEKAQVAAPYRPGRVEALFQRFEERGFPFFGTPPGLYPAFGSVYPGGGFAFGAGYRTFTGASAVVDVHALLSIATYKQVEATFRSPDHARGRLEFDGRAGWMDAPRVAYFGLGTGSASADRTVFRLRRSYLEGGMSARPARWFEIGATGGYEAFDEGAGTGRGTSIEERFTAATAPRLGEDPAFVKVSTAASVLWIESPAYSRHGGFVRWIYDGRVRMDRDGRFGVSRTEIVQHIPILRETWVVSLRGRADAIVGQVDDAPYFLMPSLGSGSTLRAYQTDRFRDRQSVLLSGEWRWIPNRLALDLALFVDAGKVGPDWAAVTHGAMHTDYGVGVRFHAPAATALRIDLARGAEGFRLVFTSSAPF
jgi:hypothetical protein